MFQSIRNKAGFIVLLFVSLLTLNLSSQQASAQAVKTDSLKLKRQHTIDSTRKAQQKILDSSKAVRRHHNDSLQQVRKLAAAQRVSLKKYKESKKYKDSVTAVRQQRLNTIKQQRIAYNDSLKRERQKTVDSINNIRKQTIALTKAAQKKKTDSLGAIRKYKESKRYQDSVAIRRQTRLDSARLVRQTKNDSLKAARKVITDAAAVRRKFVNDSLTTLRKKRTDSLEIVRKARTEKQAKQKAEREKLAKANEKKKMDKFELAIKLSIEKKHKAWSNEKMLKKKWTWPRRLVQNTFTRYNYYFNANKKMDEALANMQRTHKENYDSLISLFIFNPNKDSTKMLSDMDSIIQKASIGIQIHDPRTKWGDDLYLLLGQAFYFKGDYENAATAFRYIISINQQKKKDALKNRTSKKKTDDKEMSIVEKEDSRTFDFLKHKSANNDAVLWLARTYTDAQKEREAEAILDLLDSDKNLNEKTKGRLAIEKAYLNLNRNKERDAIQYLTEVATDKELQKWIRTRAAYLNAQLLHQQQDYAGASENYQRVLDLKPKIEMDFYARKYLAYSKLQQGGQDEEALADFKSLLRDGKYSNYYEQVYYVLGQLAANTNRFDEAITYLQKSVSSPKATKKQKAISFSSLGNVFYTKGAYKQAKMAYDSAAYFAKYAATDPLVMTAVKRATVLDKVAYPSQVIQVQDSLLGLANKSEKEQREIVKQYIRSLEKARTDSIMMAENKPGGVPIANEVDDNQNAAANSYFSNPVLMQQGFNEFKRKWGNRANVDNWWLLSKSGTNTAQAGGQNNNSSTNESEELVGFDENGIPTELSLLAQIPSSQAQKDAAIVKIKKAYLELSNAYLNDLNDYPSTHQTLDTFDKRFPNSDYQAELLYQRYQLALQENNLPLAQSYGERLRKDFPKTKWAELVGPKQQTAAAATKDTITIAIGSVNDYYEQAYQMMMSRDYSQLLQRARDGQKQYPLPAFKNKFQIMEAVALAGLGNYDDADTIIIKYQAAHPNDSLKAWVAAVANFIKRSRPVVTSTNPDSVGTLPVKVVTQPGKSTNMNQVVETAPAPPSPSNNPISIPDEYIYKPQSAHAYLFYFYKAESKTMGIKAGLGDFNAFNYSNQKLKTSMEMMKANQGIIIVESFPNATAAKIYLNAVNARKQLFAEFKASEYQVMTISIDNLLKLRSEQDMTPYLNFYKKNYK